MRFNDSVAWNTSGQYSTDLFTKRAVDIISGYNQAQPLFLYLAHLAPHAGNYDDPLQAPKNSVDKFRHISRGERRIYAGIFIYVVLLYIFSYWFHKGITPILLSANFIRNIRCQGSTHGGIEAQDYFNCPSIWIPRTLSST